MKKIVALIFIIFFHELCVSIPLFSSRSPLQLSKETRVVSSKNVYHLGLFKPAQNPRLVDRWYLGIWHRRFPKQVVWVANRQSPLFKPMGTLKVLGYSLHLIDQHGVSKWWTNGSSSTNLKSLLITGEILDTGNLVLRYSNNESSSGLLWQSFDTPTDTLLPDMELGWDNKRNVDRIMHSWRSDDDPSFGNYTFGVEDYVIPDMQIMLNGNRAYRIGRWDLETTDNNSYVSVNKKKRTYSFSVRNVSVYSVLTISPIGFLQRSTWILTKQDETKVSVFHLPVDHCDYYNSCGPNSVCDIKTTPMCNRIQGFQPIDEYPTWDLNCTGDEFSKHENIKLPGTVESNSNVYPRIGSKECEDKCLEDCTCSAYAHVDRDCVIWHGRLFDLRKNLFGGHNLFVRLATTGIGKEDKSPTKPIPTNVIILIVGIGLGVILLIYFIVFFFWKLYKKSSSATEIAPPPPPIVDLHVPQMELQTVAMATQNFSDSNKIGQGGYGIVYKGMLLDRQEIAVKRLLRRTPEGIDGVNTEVRLVGSIQHVNLVTLLGYCFEEGEMLLIYEYLENSSLDTYLFDSTKSYTLNWEKRFIIINGIARGLLYLHQDSRVRIIHRDLKPNNILLDKDMVPKISDFGMAKLFGRDEIEANTQAVAGTYGYMSPEYAIDKTYSVKSDVFSFGVVVLEILSGKKNLEFYYSNEEHLLSFIWKNWMEGKGLEIVDPVIIDSSSTFRQHEVLRCIQIGLLCVQEHAEDRPTMSSVITMLVSETTEINQPKPPGYFIGRTRFEVGSSSRKTNGESWTVAQITDSIFEGR